MKRLIERLSEWIRPTIHYALGFGTWCGTDGKVTTAPENATCVDCRKRFMEYRWGYE